VRYFSNNKITWFSQKNQTPKIKIKMENKNATVPVIEEEEKLLKPEAPQAKSFSDLTISVYPCHSRCLPLFHINKN
jgi:hypothetical protein